MPDDEVLSEEEVEKLLGVNIPDESEHAHIFDLSAPNRDTPRETPDDDEASLIASAREKRDIPVSKKRRYYREENVLTQASIDDLVLNIQREGRETYGTIPRVTCEADLSRYCAAKTMWQTLEKERFGLFTDPGDTRILRLADIPEKERFARIEEITTRTMQEGNERKHYPAFELVCYARCPFCGHIHTQTTLIDYFKAPVIPHEFRHKRNRIIEEDNRVSCRSCEKYFTPCLLIIQGDTIQSCVFLSRIQTVKAIEAYYEREQQRLVLTRNIKNINVNEGTVALDIDSETLSQAPLLFFHFFFYSPVADIRRMLASGTKDLTLFGLSYGKLTSS